MRPSRALPLLAWVAALLAIGRWLLDLGGDRLAGPGSAGPAAWWAWLGAQAPLDSAFAILRLVALAAVAYLLAVTALGLATRLAGRGRWVRLSDMASLPLVRRVLDGAVGIGFTASALGLTSLPTMARLLPPPGVAAAETVASHTPVMRAVPPLGTATMLAVPVAQPTAATPGSATMAAAPEAAPATATATMRAADPGLPGAASASASMTADPLPPNTEDDGEAAVAHEHAPGRDAPGQADAPEPSAPAASDTAQVETWTVAPGDHLWSIAEEVLTAGQGAATEGEVAGYWQRLITLNRDVLVDPDCPDLLFVGQVLDLPTP
ncbi:MAG: LysM peptidoglycan-binding domain-containing protein [Acidimicrobiia bacterium]|nr:LysM peptidoglycan-binding domain-containing protein [Acidimicrobiia bacterium]